MKFADDSVGDSLLKEDEMSHGPVLKYFSKWCQEAFLESNVTKAKDMCIDFRSHHLNSVKTKINGLDVEVKYLGTIIDNKLSFYCKTNMLSKKSPLAKYPLAKTTRLFVRDRSK